jgi:predicted porin
MRNKLIAVAVASLSLNSAGFAQSNVTLYGVADATFESVSAKGATVSGASRGNFTRVNSNSSYVGLKGSEDLGDGLKAIFQFETGFNTDAGVFSGAGRDTFVGLNGNFGTIKLGNLTGPARYILTKLDLLPGLAGIGTSDSLLGRGINASGATSTIFNSRIANTISYISPAFSNFTVTADYAAGENKSLDNAPVTTQANGKIYEIGLTYAEGPWLASYAHSKDDFGANALAGTNTLLDWRSDRLGVGYTFEAGHRINVILDRQKQEVSKGIAGAGASTDLQKTSWSLQGLYKVSAPGSLLLAYTRSNQASGSFLASNADTAAKALTVGYLHALSKRTLLKAVYSKISNENNVAYDFAANGAAVAGGFGTGADPQGLALGVRHSF